MIMTYEIVAGVSIVLIDTDPHWLTSSSVYLEGLGYTFRCFNDFASATRGTVINNQTLVIASYRCFREIGFSLRQLTIAAGNRPRLILLLDSQSPSLIRNCFKAGAYDCLLKPPSSKGLANLLQSTLNLPAIRLERTTQ